jgi:branched-chain amino acid transport system permease protein
VTTVDDSAAGRDGDARTGGHSAPAAEPRAVGAGGAPRAVPPPQRRHQFAAVGVFVAVCAVLVPLLGGGIATQHRINLWLAYAIAAVGFYWVFGLAGRFAFCQTFMMALGGFTSAWVTRTMGDTWFLVGLAAAMANCAGVAAVVGLITARSREFYFAVGTLAVTQVGIVILDQATGFTGPNGTTVGVSIPRIGGTVYVTERDAFWLFLTVLSVILVVGALIERSPIARDAVATRTNATVARTAGVPTIRVPTVLFALGSAAGGLSGALIAHWTGTISTQSFGISLAIGIFTMLILGGIGSMWGAVVGAGVYVAIPQALRGFDRWQLVVYGLVLLVAIIAMPQGIVGLVATLRSRRRTHGTTRRSPVLDRMEQAIR